jgi:hypothetical protein
MGKRMVVTVPHESGVREAQRRLDARLGWARAALAKHGIAVEVSEWRGPERSFAVRALGQRVEGEIRAAEDHVRFEAELPLVLAMFRGRIEAVVAHHAPRILAA